MIDRSISAMTTASVLLWVAGFALTGAEILGAGHGWGELGVMVGVLGGLINIRKLFDDMRVREKAAFDLGCEAARAVPRIEEWTRH